MSSNQQIILTNLLQQQKQIQDASLSDDSFFHIFVTEQVLKNYELSYDELQEGIVDNGGDGGIDAIYTFVNGDLVQRDSPLSDGKRNSLLEVFIIQSKTSKGFSESALEKCTASAADLFDLTKESDDLKSIYNQELLANREVFKKQFLALASKFPILRFRYFYATMGTEVHDNVRRKVEQLRETILRHFDKAEIQFEFLGAGELIELSRREQIKARDIALADNPISTQDGGYIALVPLESYYKFISEDNGELIKYFFDSNIRDYQGENEVNTEIEVTLNSKDIKEDFWWLNNGVTITASDATFASKRLHVEEPQIVNGLQTSFELHKYFSTNKIQDDKRSLLVRIVKTKDEKSRLSVIKATNSQTKIPAASLRATDPIHRDIEDFLLTKGYYYDRRKNYHKNQGRPLNKIVGIPFLAQIIMAGFQEKPDYARARPSTLIKDNRDYESIFNKDLPIELYYKLLIIHLTAEARIKQYTNPKFTRPQIGDIRFHVTMYLIGKMTGKIKPRAEEIAAIDLASLSIQSIDEAIDNVFVVYDSMGGTDAIAKGREFVAEVSEQLQNHLPTKTPPNMGFASGGLRCNIQRQFFN